MTKTRISWIVLVCVAVAACVWAINHNVSTDAQERRIITRWEYARLYIGDGKPVFVEASRKSTVDPPLNPLSGNISRSGQVGERYTLVSKVVRDHDVGALNYFGRQGWEAVSVAPADKGFIVLMKRPY